MLIALDDARAEYVVVGAYALVAYRAPRRNLTVADLHAPDTIYQIGLPPFRIDILTSISGVEFDIAWQRRIHAKLEDYQVAILGKEDLLTNKLASGRPKDLLDAAWLQEQARNQ